VAESNRKLAPETLEQSRDRFRAGVADTVEVVQAQESVATAEQDYINAVYMFNLAQVSLARGKGDTQQGIARIDSAVPASGTWLYGKQKAGEVLSPGGFAIILLLPVVGYLVSHVDARYLIATGFLVTALALFHMTHWTLGVYFRTAMMARVYQATNSLSFCADQ
jgi:hypothetical protein